MVCGAQKGWIDSIQLNFIETPHTAGGGLVAGRGCGGARGGIRAEGGQEEAFREAGRTNPPEIRDRWQPLCHGRRSIRPQRAQHQFCPRSKSSPRRPTGPSRFSCPAHPGGVIRAEGPDGPSRAVGCSARQSRAAAARRGRTHPFCPRSKSSPPFPLGPSRFSYPAHPGGVIRAEGPDGPSRAVGCSARRSRVWTASGRHRPSESHAAASGGGVRGRARRRGGGVGGREAWAGGRVGGCTAWAWGGAAAGASTPSRRRRRMASRSTHRWRVGHR